MNRQSYDHAELTAGLANVERLVAGDRKFEALKSIRALLPIEAQIIEKNSTLAPEAAA